MDKQVIERVTEASVRRRAQQFAFLKDLIHLDTTTGADDLAKSCDTLAAILERLGFEVAQHAPAQERFEAVGRTPFANLVVRSAFGQGPTLALVSHVDTPAPVSGWDGDPFEGAIANGKLYGLGAVSGKGHLAAQIFAILALSDAGAAPKGVIELHISFDGSRGGALGAKWMLSEERVKPDFAVVGGPARAIATESMGSMIIDVEVRGKEAPVYAAETGLDALEAATSALSRVYQFRSGLRSRTPDVAGLGTPSVVVEHIEGGGRGGTVPGLVRFRIDRRMLPEEDPGQVETQLTNLIGSTIAKSVGVRCRIRRSVLIPPMRMDAVDSLLFDALMEPLQNKLGARPEPHGTAFDHEGRHYAAAGIPTVLYGAGPLDPAAAGMGGANEELVLDDLRLGTEVLALGALALLSE